MSATTANVGATARGLSKRRACALLTVWQDPRPHDINADDARALYYAGLVKPANARESWTPCTITPFGELVAANLERMGGPA